MKKKFSLLVVFLCLFSISLSKVNALCGYRYFNSMGTYVMYAEKDGYCYPLGRWMASARGIMSDQGWNTQTPSSVSCNSSDCVYIFKGTSGLKCINYYNARNGTYNINATKKIACKAIEPGITNYQCMRAWYDNPPKKANNFATVEESEICLQRKINPNSEPPWKAHKGDLYATDEYGYKKVDMEKCGTPKDPGNYDPSSEGNGCRDNNLYQTCRGTNVKNLQIKLEAVQKCGIDIDGSYGPSTKSCVIAFQKASGLDADGYAGPKTISALDAAYTKLQKENSDKTAQEGKFLKVYNITYDTNGGTFANGETKRAVYYIENESTIAPATIPGKKGYKFVGWYNGSEKYVFGNKLSGNINLTAKYEKSSTTKYCLEGDILDIDNNQCITLQEFSDEDAIKFYMTGNNKKQTIQTIFNATRSCPNNVYTVTEKDAVGSNNTVVCDGDNGYMRDTWRAAWNCYDDTQCPLSGSADCNETFRGTCYAAYSPGDTALAEEPDSDSKTKYTQTIKNNATESPQTGGGIIALILVTLSIVGLAIYCYNVYNKKSEEV